MAKRILRPKQIMQRLGIAPTQFWANVEAGIIVLFPISRRAKGQLEETTDKLVERIARGDVRLVSRHGQRPDLRQV